MPNRSRRSKKSRVSARKQRLLKIRETSFPESDYDTEVWSKSTNGFTAVPRVLSLAVAIINDAGKMRAGTTYLALWCRDWEQTGVVELDDLDGIATEAGFAGTRRARSLIERVHVLRDLGFIRLADKGSRKGAIALLRDPHLVIAELHHNASITTIRFEDVMHRCIDIGVDMSDYVESLESDGAVDDLDGDE